MAKTIFRLPSDPDIEVTLREPTVADCIDFASFDENLNERSTTLFLNQLSSSESRNWTMLDRIAAVWWVFITTSKDTELAYEYHCDHCGKPHATIIDLIDLDDEATSLMMPPFINDEVQFNGVTRQIKIKPFDGWVTEQLEQYWLHLKTLSPDSVEYKKLLAEIKVMEIVYSFQFIDDEGNTPVSSLEQKEEKLAAINAMSRINEFPELVAAIEAANKYLNHGLKHTYKDGVLQLLSPVITTTCPDKEQGDKEPISDNMRLLVPFQCHYFIPQI